MQAGVRDFRATNDRMEQYFHKSPNQRRIAACQQRLHDVPELGGLAWESPLETLQVYRGW
jgi:hypothetical protein